MAQNMVNRLAALEALLASWMAPPPDAAWQAEQDARRDRGEDYDVRIGGHLVHVIYVDPHPDLPQEWPR
jgi:hypothetical protein